MASHPSLPESIKPTTWLDEAMENLRTSRKLHPVAWRLSTASAGIVAAAILFGSFLAFNQHHQVRSEHKSRINFIFHTIDMLNDSEIHLQRMATVSGNTARAWQLQTIARLASEARAAGNIEATEKYCQLADNLLRRWSGEEFNAIRSRCPANPLPEKTSDLLIWLEAYSNFNNSPLAEYLQDVNMLELSETLLLLQNKLLEQWAGPLPGSSWAINGDQDLSFSYIPACRANRSSHTGWAATKSPAGWCVIFCPSTNCRCVCVPMIFRQRNYPGTTGSKFVTN